jgi:hypothetical protein
MPLVTTAKANSLNSNTPSHVISRQEVSIAKPTGSTARAEALKARLMGSTSTQPIAPRPAGSSARQEAFSKAQKFAVQPQQQPKVVNATPPRTPARAIPTDFSNMELPPSGLTPGSEASPQPANTTEAPKAAPEATSEPLSPQADALARREIQLRKAQQRLKAEQEAWKLEKDKYVPKERISSETLKVLAEANVTPDKLVELQINQASSQDPQQVLLNRISELETKLQGIVDPENGALAQRDKAAYTQVIKQIRSDAQLLVDSDPSYGLIKSEGQTEEVVKLIDSVFDSEGIVLDVEEAAQLVEEKLAERLARDYERLSKYDKIIAKYGKPAENPAEAVPAQQSQHKAPINSTTLTNAGSATAPMSSRDRAVLKVQAALNAAKGR